MMDRIRLKKTGLVVSQLCFGTGKMQKLSPKQGGELLKKAFERGVYFWDTSDNYGSHKHVREGLNGLDREKIILMSKITNIFEKSQVKPHVEGMLNELGTGYLDILLLHAVDSQKELEKYLGIIDELKPLPINHIGLSSHKPKIISQIAEDPRIKFILAPLNYQGWKIKTDYLKFSFRLRRNQMIRALKKCRENGKDIFLMKVFGEGRIKDIEKAMEYCLSQNFADGVDIGITNQKELNEDIELVERFG